jgi:hypothetical protein
MCVRQARQEAVTLCPLTPMLPVGGGWGAGAPPLGSWGGFDTQDHRSVWRAGHFAGMCAALLGLQSQLAGGWRRDGAFSCQPHTSCHTYCVSCRFQQLSGVRADTGGCVCVQAQPLVCSAAPHPAPTYVYTPGTAAQRAGWAKKHHTKSRLAAAATRVGGACCTRGAVDVLALPCWQHPCGVSQRDVQRSTSPSAHTRRRACHSSTLGSSSAREACPKLSATHVRNLC